MPRLCSSLLLSLLIASAASGVTMDWTPVGKPGNACDPQSQGCFGTVDYYYRIGTYEVTNAQYAEFLNAKAASDPLGLWSSSMKIARSGTDGSYHYSVIAGREDMPINYVSVFDAMRFANWMSNGEANGDTETGSYTLLGPYDTFGYGGAMPSNGTTVTRNPGATILLSSENEWYKAAYYYPATASYVDYPTGVGAHCGAAPTTALDEANCGNAVGSLTSVGSYSGSTSAFGTFDQGGNVIEWNETIKSESTEFGDPGWREFRGGNYVAPVQFLHRGVRNFTHPNNDSNDSVGFRVSMTAAHFEYAGNAFTLVTENTPPNGAYTTANRVRGIVAFTGPLAPNLTNALINDQVVGFRFDDGRGVLDETTAVLTFFLSTDSNGEITEWEVEAESRGHFPFDQGERRHSILTRNTSGFIGDDGITAECVNPAGCQQFGPPDDFSSDLASNTNSAGTFPEPGSLVVLGVGIGALGMLAGSRRARA